MAKWRAIKLTNSINESCPRAVGSRGDHAQRRRHVGLTKNAKTLMVAIGKQNDDTSLTLTVAEIRR
jgi:hypothetical protein